MSWNIAKGNLKIFMWADCICMCAFIAGAEKMVGWALSYHLMQTTDADAKDAKLVLSSERYLTNFHHIFFLMIDRM